MTGAAPSRRRLVAGLVALTALGIAVRTVHLGDQPVTPDDADVGQTARNFVETGWPEPTMWNHPRLRDALVDASLDALGRGPWGLKAWSVLLGALTVPAAAWLAFLLTGSGGAAAILGLLLALDPLHVDFSRQAINDVYLGFFPVAAVAAAWRYRATRRTGWLVLAGALFGLGLASKWSALLPLAVTAAVLARDVARTRGSARERSAEVAFAASCLVVLPLAVYLATFLPWFGRGYGLTDWLGFQRSMAVETATHVGYAGTKRPGYAGELVGAWRWFVSPAWYVDRTLAADRGGEGAFLVGIGNPVTWLVVWPSLAYAGWCAWRRRDAAAAILAALFLASYLPLVATARPIWTNTALAVLPFAMALVAFAAARLGALRPRLVGAWLAAAVLAGALLWFPATGIRTAAGDRLAHALVPDDAFAPRPGEAP
ncbi:MAG TPA: phospholipid carrier-dependent glycosyltransferase [Anaeromyxobacteraceae bacterium]|nr:phospholipid carrier-dependent glycosyltransferase [Anaeromyxobacteraceae bacterium]